jgi:hypothetical protein
MLFLDRLVVGSWWPRRHPSPYRVNSLQYGSKAKVSKAEWKEIQEFERTVGKVLLAEYPDEFSKVEAEKKLEAASESFHEKTLTYLEGKRCAALLLCLSFAVSLSPLSFCFCIIIYPCRTFATQYKKKHPGAELPPWLSKEFFTLQTNFSKGMHTYGYGLRSLPFFLSDSGLFLHACTCIVF